MNERFINRFEYYKDADMPFDMEGRVPRRKPGLIEFFLVVIML